VKGDADYDVARSLHDISFDREPWMVVRARSASDVVQAVRFARLHRLPLTARSGGHSVAGHSSIDGAVVVDVANMRGVYIDAEKKTARVQAGATSGDLAGPAHAYGLALSTGDTETVGIAGLTLGGGIGFIVRKYGLAIDNLLSVEIVTAEGRLIRASKDQHSDLFWALRGGGGNFGIVTEFEFQLAPVGAVYGGGLVLPATREVIRRYADYALTAPDELTTISQVMKAPPVPFIPEELWGETVFFIMLVYAGDMEDGERAVAPIRALAEPIADLVGPMPYPAIYQLTQAAAARHGAEVRSGFSAELPDDVIDSILERVSAGSAPLTMVQLRPLGGAFSAVAPGETAFAHRASSFLILVVAGWFDPQEGSSGHRQWALDTWDAIKHIRDGVYVNFVADEGEARVREAYPGATYDRLAEVKRRYDPNNIFQLNQNIRPA
jgi:FAD/FMN-containing dehydrogenase